MIFWNVDTQRDFMLPDGKLYVQGSEKIFPLLKMLTFMAKDNNIKVVNTCDYHSNDDKEISINPDFVNTFPAHCLASELGSDFIPETYPKERGENYYIVGKGDKEINEANFNKARNIIIEKDKFNVFDGNGLTEKVLELLSPETVVVYGVTTQVCVNEAVLGLAKRGWNVAVLSDAIWGLPNFPVSTAEYYKKWIDAGVSIINTGFLTG